MHKGDECEWGESRKFSGNNRLMAVISSNVYKHKTGRYPVGGRKMRAGRVVSRQQTSQSVWRGIREEEKTYFEYLIENQPLLHEPLGVLIDGDALPPGYVGKQTDPHGSSAHIQWGRVLRHVAQTVNFHQSERDVVEASLVSTLEGALKISAPYHLSRRKRHAVLFKPFRETYVQKVLFRRISNSSDPEKSWKLVAVSVGMGGTEKSDVEIDLLRLRGMDEIGYQIQSPLLQMYSLNGTGQAAPLLATERQAEVEVRIRSQEMEQNMVVLRSAVGDDEVIRTQLQYLADRPEGAGYFQTYCGRCTTGNEPKLQSLVVESVSRSSLFDTGAPVQTSYWVFPVKIQETSGM